MTGLHLAPRPLFLHFRILFSDLCAQGHGRHSSQFVEICIGCTCTSPSFFLLVIGTLALKNISFHLFPRHCLFQWNGLCIQVYIVQHRLLILCLQVQSSQGSDWAQHWDLTEIQKHCTMATFLRIIPLYMIQGNYLFPFYSLKKCIRYRGIFYTIPLYLEFKINIFQFSGKSLEWSPN